ncbi:MAG TPA: hypothetical protein DDW68_01795 [Verrucomicrobiales bacterium]|nr:hypothetical protein [Verrucomicrobiales bacterium]HBE95888.1 hypothetical protein [Verrucomicrobiales bacterium]
MGEFCFSTEKMGVCFHASAVSSRKLFDEWSVGLFDEALWGLLDLLDEIQLEFGEADYRRRLIVYTTVSLAGK